MIEELIRKAVDKKLQAEDQQIESDLLMDLERRGVSIAQASEFRDYEVIHQQRPDIIGSTYRGIRRNGEWVIDHYPDWAHIE